MRKRSTSIKTTSNNRGFNDLAIRLFDYLTNTLAIQQQI